MLLSRRLVTDPINSDAYRVFEMDMADLSEMQLMRGMEKSRDFVGFFTLPAFREMCRIRPEDYGIPDMREALFEACKAMPGHQWSHPAVYHAAMAVGSFDLKSKTEKELWPQWEYAYSQVVRKVIDGEDLNIPVPKALPEKVFVPADEAKAVESLGKLKSMFEGA